MKIRWTGAVAAILLFLMAFLDSRIKESRPSRAPAAVVIRNGTAGE